MPMFKAILKFLTGAPGEQIGQYFAKKQQLKHDLQLAKLQGKIDIANAKTQAAIKQQEHVQTWEQTFVNMQRESKKDEVVLAVVLAPYIGAFIPVVQDYVLVGFQYLAQMPYWAVGLTVAICLAIYGIRHRNANRLAAPGLRDRDVVEVSNGSTAEKS